MGRRRSRVLLGCSGNLELALFTEETPGFRKGRKHLVRAIYEEIDPDTGDQTFTVVGMNRRKITLSGENGRWIPAGSSINCLRALYKWGVRGISLCLAAGQGAGAETLRGSLRSRVRDIIEFPAEGTPRTLALHHSNGDSTLLCHKTEYSIPEEHLTFLREGCAPKVCILTSVREADLPAVEAVYANQSILKRAIIPHASLLQGKAKRRFLALTPTTDLVQVNADEASILLGWDEVTPENAEKAVRRMAKLTRAGINVITLNSHGSIALDARGKLVCQESFPVTAIDTCGAGDSHFGALCYALFLRKGKLGLQNGLALAAWVGAQVASAPGPIAALPTHAQVEAFIRNRTMPPMQVEPVEEAWAS